MAILAVNSPPAFERLVRDGSNQAVCRRGCAVEALAPVEVRVEHRDDAICAVWVHLFSGAGASV